MKIEPRNDTANSLSLKLGEYKISVSKNSFCLYNPKKLRLYEAFDLEIEFIGIYPVSFKIGHTKNESEP